MERRDVVDCTDERVLRNEDQSAHRESHVERVLLEPTRMIIIDTYSNALRITGPPLEEVVSNIVEVSAYLSL
jgi:hypothetical protein